MRSPITILRCCAGVLVATAGMAVWGQLTEGPIKGFQRADVDSETGRRRSLLSGGSMEQLSNRELRISGGVRVEVYDLMGGTNLVVTAPGCFYDTETRSVYSPGPLRFTTGSGQFELEGEGFLLQQQGARLTISNRVRAVLSKGLLSVPGTTNRPAAVTSLSAADAGSDRTVRVDSDWFESSTNLAVFHDNVRVEDAEGRMRCRRLSLNFAEAGRQIDRVLAEEQVEFESGDLTARSEKADYRLAEETVRLDGRPSWRQGERQGSAEWALIRRSTRELEAEGDVRVRMPAAAMGHQGEILGLQGGKSRGDAAPPAASGTLAAVEVFAEACRFRPDPAATNRMLGSFDRNVRVLAAGGSLRCGQLQVVSSGDGGRAEQLTALGDVVVEEGKDRLQGARLHYTATNQWVEVTGEPRWWIDGSEGTAGLLRLDLGRQSYLAQRQVRMRVPGEAMGGAFGVLPQFAQQTNRVAAVLGAATVASPASSPPAPSTEPRVISIASEELEFLSGAREGRGDRIEYRGGVRVEDGEQTTLTSERLTGVTVVGTNRLENLVAEGGVVVEVKAQRGARFARGDRLEYRAGPGEVELTGREGVELVLEDPAGATRSRGTRLLYRVLPDVLEMAGRPEVTSPRGTARGDAVWVDRPRTTVHATGNWKIHLRAESFGKVRPLPTLPAGTGPVIR